MLLLLGELVENPVCFVAAQEQTLYRFLFGCRQDSALYVAHYMRWFDGVRVRRPINKVLLEPTLEHCCCC
jgi:hypothetical protein